MHPSELMTMLIHIHQSPYWTFKACYAEYRQVHLTGEFSHHVISQRFVGLIPPLLVPMLVYLSHRYGSCTGINCVDSTSFEACHPKRISQHRVFAGEAARGKTSVGWFFGFKLRPAVNGRGELLT